MSDASLRFLGAAGTVTGSKHLLSAGGRRVLLDCGLFQGLKQLRMRNWTAFPFDPAALDAVVLSHAHVDHSGALPLLVRRGFRGEVHCTEATGALLGVLLLDAAHLQEEEAEFANRHRTSRHSPALPLFTTVDAQAALGRIIVHPYGTPFTAAHGIAAEFDRAGHILGAAIVRVRYGGTKARTLVFSGDLGRYGRALLRDPEPIGHANVVLVESTYGDRTHAPGAIEELGRIVRATAERGGVLLIPAFAVDRTQELLFALHRLEDAREIPDLPVYIDSPMAIDVTAIYAHHPEEHGEELRRLHGAAALSPRHLRLLRTPEESKSLNDQRGPMIVISASGMASGGRVLHHLLRRLPDPDATVLLVGFQAAGTRGRTLQDGGKALRMFGQEVAVRARVVKLDGLSAHADQGELLRWLGTAAAPPEAAWVVHGEPQAADTLAALVRHRLGWPARVAEDGAEVPI